VKGFVNTIPGGTLGKFSVGLAVPEVVVIIALRESGSQGLDLLRAPAFVANNPEGQNSTGEQPRWEQFNRYGLYIRSQHNREFTQ
jgi:hypothetical protein